VKKEVLNDKCFMKKLLLTILLTISTNAMAEWTLIEFTDETMVYADVKTIRKLGNKVKMWTLWDFKVPKSLKNESYLSFVSFVEYDCVNVTKKYLASNFYSENMQKGRPISGSTYAANETTNEAIAPNTLDEAAWEKACRKK
jgi:hypothetical protein